MKRFYGPLVCLMVLTACASTPPVAPKDQDSEAKQFQTNPSSANVYVYRTVETLHSTLALIRLQTPNVIYACRLDSKMFVEFQDIAPGDYTITVPGSSAGNLLIGLTYVDGSKDLPISFEAGKNYFFVAGIQTVFLGHNWTITEKSQNDALDDLRKCQLISSEMVHKVDPKTNAEIK
jgi:hypothetical protein